MTDTTPNSPFLETDLLSDPLQQLQKWWEEAEQAIGPQASAMTLATADAAGRPAARIVLLRGLDQRGLVFFTSYTSRKAGELTRNPAAALLFHWPPLSRQVRIEGRAEKISRAESDAYFAGRPRGHQLEAHASPQSQVIADRAWLEKRFREAEEDFAGGEVPRPQNWGGYRVVPESVEFWQEGEHRLHDRLRYQCDLGEAWRIERLAP